MSEKKLTAVGLILAVTLALSACSSAGDDTRHYTIGLVTNNTNGLRNVEGFRDEMAELGYIEGENLTYIYEGGPTSGDELDAALEGIVEAGVDLIFTAGTPTGVAAHRITAGTGIPVIFGVIADPVAAGVLDDLTRPGGNMTGVMLSQNQAKRLEQLLEIAPGIQRVFVPYNPDDTAASTAVAQITEVASGLGVVIVTGEARDDDQVTELLNNIPTDIDAIFLVPDSVVNARLEDILDVAIDHMLPTSGPSTAQVEEGALTAYGIIHREAGAQAARIADRVLRGADPGELPVETAEFFLAVNLQMADVIGLEIPDAVLQQAEIIIRTDEE